MLNKLSAVEMFRDSLLYKITIEIDIYIYIHALQVNASRSDDGNVAMVNAVTGGSGVGQKLAYRIPKYNLLKNHRHNRGLRY